MLKWKWHKVHWYSCHIITSDKVVILHPKKLGSQDYKGQIPIQEALLDVQSSLGRGTCEHHMVWTELASEFSLFYVSCHLILGLRGSLFSNSFIAEPMLTNRRVSFCL